MPPIGCAARSAGRSANDLHAELDALAAELVALWPHRNRPGGMTDSVIKLVASKALLDR